MGQIDLGQRIAAVRRFNRFYTSQIGVLQEDYLDSPFSLTEVRVLYELAHRENPTACELSRELRLDPGYLSRLLRGFEKRGLIDKQRSQLDGRQNLLRLTGEGQEAFAPLDSRSGDQARDLLSGLSATDQGRLVEAMGTIQRLLGAQPEPRIPYLLRPHRHGDMGWIAHRHGVLYNQEYGYDERFEALVASIVAEFIEHYEPKRERCWIAEREGEIVGSVFLVGKSEAVAKLRLFLVEPKARGLGIGTRLVDECVQFARSVGYRQIVLWTQSELSAARRIYERAGFRLVAEEPHHSWGRDLVAETWQLEL
ncbi:MAG: bifunctional helix-turn-helix transcriptional regulator/GNAT family N-acetyltransferase [Chloroflexota bacterium]